MDIIKKICTNYNELISFLTDCNFTTVIDNNKYYYTPLYENKQDAVIDNIPYYEINENSASSLIIQNEQKLEPFDVTQSSIGCLAVKLLDGGIAICISQIANGVHQDKIYFCCENNYTRETDEEAGTSELVPKGKIMNNGLLVLTPAEDDYDWRAGWRDEQKGEGEDPTHFQWNTLNIKTGNISYGSEANSEAKIIENHFGVSLVKMAFNDTNTLSKYIYLFVSGIMSAPGATFTIHGYNFIAFTDNTVYRCPVFKLATPARTINDSSLTRKYESTKIYKVGDYCIYNDLLWKCIQEVDTPSVFDQSYWENVDVISEILDYEE